MLKFRLRISTQLYAAFCFIVAITIVAVGVSWQSYESIGQSQSRVKDVSLPETVEAFAIARSSAALAAAAPRLTASANQDELQAVADEVGRYREELTAQLDEVVRIAGQDLSLSRIRTTAEELVSNLDALEASRRHYFEVVGETATFHASLRTFEERLHQTLLPSIDDKFFYLATGYYELGEPPHGPEVHMSSGQINEYRHLASLERNANIAIQLLTSSRNLDDSARIGVMQEQFESIADNSARSLEVLEAGERSPQVSALFARLLEMGFGERNGFVLRRQELDILDEQSGLLARSRELAVQLVADVEVLVDHATEQADSAVRESTEAVERSRRILIVLGIVSILASLLVAWLIVGRVIVRRLEALSERMRKMAGGELEQPVKVSGSDEIAEMAGALEVFRAHALEIQRLNLVEELAKEVQETNDELTQVLSDLKAAQNQIVMREKLAALGELTAGVAHEIKNPLNFVKNFSELSLELIEELDEVIDMTDESREEQLEEIREIAGMLSENMTRIKNHGNRADRIVHDMLSLGRGEGKAQEIDMNVLVQENAKLAFHGMRSTLKDFQLHMTFELDPAVGKAVVIPQDFGRVIVNIVGNSCHATNEKALKLGEKAGRDGRSDYLPTLGIRTERLNSHIRIAIRDNGFGIPNDVRDKIFNPFFTTKPPEEGTGLGLAISNDIVRQHGGTFTVTTEPGEYTEMIIEVPDDARESLQEAVDEDN